MRTRNEKILLAVLVFIIFGAANFYGYEWYARKQTQLTLENSRLLGDQAEAQVDLQKESLWAQRKAWIQEHEPALDDSGGAGATMLEYVLKGARDHKLDIMEQSLSGSDKVDSGTRISVTVKVKGSMESLCRWLSELQQPESFYAVSTCSMKADEDQKSMVCSLSVARYFK